MAEGRSGFENIDTTMNGGLRNTIHTETEEEQMQNSGSTEGYDHRNNCVSLSSENENASYICDNENGFRSNANESDSQESAREYTNSAKADCVNKTEITRSLQKVVKRVSDQEQIPNTRSISGDVNREVFVNGISDSRIKIGTCDNDTDVESNGNVFEPLQSTSNDIEPTSANSVCQYTCRCEATNTTLSYISDLNIHGKEVQRYKKQEGYYVPREKSCKNQICKNENSGRVHIGSLDPDYQTKSGIYHSSTFTDESWNESSETCTQCKSEPTGEAKSQAMVDLQCNPQTLANQDAGSILKEECGTSVIANSANEGPSDETDSELHGKETEEDRHTTSRNKPKSLTSLASTGHREGIESIEGTLYDSSQTKVGKHDSCKLNTCNAGSSARAGTVGTELHVVPSANGATENKMIKMGINTSGNKQRRITPESQAIEQHSSEISVIGDANADVQEEAVTILPEHVAEESSGIGYQDEVYNVLSDREQGQFNSKAPQRITADEESDKRVDSAIKHSQCVTSVSKHDGEEDRHDGLPDNGQQRAAASGSHNVRSITNHGLQGCERHSTFRGCCMQSSPSNGKHEGFKSKQKPTKSAVQESSKQSISTRERSQCRYALDMQNTEENRKGANFVTSKSRLPERQHGQREGQQAATIPFVSVRNQDTEAGTGIRPSTSRGNVYDGRSTGLANTGQRQGKTLSESIATADQESRIQTELARNYPQRISHRHDVAGYRESRHHEQKERGQPAVRFDSVETRRAQDLQAGTRPCTSRASNGGDDDNGGDDGGGDDGGGGGGQDANRRLFDCQCLTVSLQSTAQFQQNNTVNNIHLDRLRLNQTDDDTIKRFFGIKHFHFLFQEDVSNDFVFQIGNRSINEAIEVLNEIKGRLKQLCYARFCGTIVNGIQITNPDDLKIIFGFTVINPYLNYAPSLQMVV